MGVECRRPSLSWQNRICEYRLEAGGIQLSGRPSHSWFGQGRRGSGSEHRGLEVVGLDCLVPRLEQGKLTDTVGGTISAAPLAGIVEALTGLPEADVGA